MEQIQRLFLFILICALLKQVQSCEQNWLSFESKCILIQPGSYSIDESCMARGWDPVSIPSERKLKFLTMHMKPHIGENFWVGVFESRSELTWMDGTRADQSWIDVPEDPGILEDDEHRYNLFRDNRIGFDERLRILLCFAFDGEHVRNHSCTSKFGFICEKDKPRFNPTENCLIGHTEHSFIGEISGDCLYRSPDATTRDKAEEECAKTGGRFLNLQEISEEGFSAFRRHQVMMNDGFKYWNTYGESSRGSCVTVSFNYTGTLRRFMNPTDCQDHAHVICAAPRVTSTVPPSTSDIVDIVVTPTPQLMQILMCPQGLNWKTFRNNGKCYWETSFETSRMSWDGARDFCKAYGGDLASFHSLDEEKVGLSFQYGSLSHPYWIGLKLDIESETYKWSDGSPLDYQNWAPGHPNHQDKRLRCVAMDAANKHWESSLCGIMSWFVCQAPKSPNPTRPVLPTPTPLEDCNMGIGEPTRFYFEGYCYQVVNLQGSWHRAKEYCENMGSNLLSIHSDDEIGFLLRMLYEDKGTRGNRVWIGLNSLSGTFRWSDGSPVDLTYWNQDEPNNYMNQEKCGNMYIGNGLWNDENCNVDMGFICKFRKDATDNPITVTTIDPTIGNCKKGWFNHGDKCYLPVGYREKDRVNWTTAQSKCQEQNGYLVSIRDMKEQAFLSYLMQGLKSDTWIGFHDTLQSGRYFWVDNSDNQFTNWAIGEPSFFGIIEDCVKMVYHTDDSGTWKDDECYKEYAYICQTAKDPNLPLLEYDRGINCLHPEGWIKLNDMCFKMFTGQPASWWDAKRACEDQGAELVSITSYSVQAVTSYLGFEVNQTFWIGLQFEENSQKYKWANGWEMTLSRWGNNNPIIPRKLETCFSSSPDGIWSRYPCDEQKSFICQISPGKGPVLKKYKGDCPKTTKDWLPTDGSYCYWFGREKADWFISTLRCFHHGSYLISIHSLEDLERIRQALKKSLVTAPSVYIGLIRNQFTGGFHWADGSPVDFVNWEEGEPSNDNTCVEMMTHSLKWRVVTCAQPRHFVCAHVKEEEIVDYPEKAGLEDDSPAQLSAGALSAIVVCITLVVFVAAAVAIFFLHPPLGRSRFIRLPFFRQHSTSFENALYNVHSSSMEFQEDNMS